VNGPLAQELASAILVLAALAYLAWRGWRSVVASRRRRAGCGRGCECGPTS